MLTLKKCYSTTSSSIYCNLGRKPSGSNHNRTLLSHVWIDMVDYVSSSIVLAGQYDVSCHKPLLERLIDYNSYISCLHRYFNY